MKMNLMATEYFFIFYHFFFPYFFFTIYKRNKTAGIYLCYVQIKLRKFYLFTQKVSSKRKFEYYFLQKKSINVTNQNQPGCISL